MDILVVNGSPKGCNSITVQSVKYLEKRNRNHCFTYLDAAQKIKALEKDFTEAKEALEKADVILFSYPVYTFIAPSQLHTFIRLMKQHSVDVRGKICTQLTTSKHFYDITAHNYIRDNAFDMGLSFIPGLSADMDDLLKEKGRKEADEWFRHFLWAVENKVFLSPVRTPLSLPDGTVTIPEREAEKKNRTVVILTDSTNTNSTLERMTERFRKVLPYHTKIVDLGKYPFKGGCIGCFHCAPEGKCIWKDNFDTYLRTEIQSGDSIVFAFNILDHSMGPRFKLYDDRQFCNGHRTVTSGMPMAYLVTGNLDAEENLRMIIEGRGQVGGNYIAGVARSTGDVDREIDTLAKNLEYAIEKRYEDCSNFLGIGGMRIFRDLIYLMQGMMRADHKFYKERGIYDTFPQKQRGTIFKMRLVGMLMNNPALMKKAGSRMTDGMLGPYRKVLEKVEE